MAGRRHHIIPRLLQKGFASNIDGETIHTWQYLGGTEEPTEVSTRDTIVSKHFYGKGELNADDIITELERAQLSPLVDGLRSGAVDSKRQSKEIAELIAHLSIRSKLIRKGFENLSNRFLGEMKGIFANPETVDGILRSAPDTFVEDQFDTLLANPPAELNDAMRMFEALGLSNDDVRSLMTSLIQSEMQDADKRSERVNFVTDVFRRIFDVAPKTVSKSIKDGHIKALIANVVPAPRVEIFQSFVWRVATVDFDLILGDAPCLFRAEGSDYLVPSCEPKKALAAYLPISTNQLLLGTLSSEAEENISSEFNQAIASCSYEQFIAAFSSNGLRDLIPLIGTRSSVANDAEIDAEIEQIRGNINTLIYGSNDVD